MFMVKVAGDANKSSPTLSELRAKGAFGFPQKDAKVFCDQGDLRLSVWNNAEYLFAQAILWTDGESEVGRTEDNREIGDWSTLMLDLDADGKATPDVDRDYSLNPWPAMGGLNVPQIFAGRPPREMVSLQRRRSLALE